MANSQVILDGMSCHRRILTHNLQRFDQLFNSFDVVAFCYQQRRVIQYCDPLYLD